MTKVSNMPIGWLSPKGDMYECSYMEHYDLAEDLLYNNKYLNRNYGESVSDALLRYGWIQITRNQMLDHNYHIIYEQHITDEQGNYLRDFIYNKDIAFDSLERKILKHEIDGWDE